MPERVQFGDQPSTDAEAAPRRSDGEVGQQTDSLRFEFGDRGADRDAGAVHGNGQHPSRARANTPGSGQLVAGERRPQHVGIGALDEPGILRGVAELDDGEVDHRARLVARTVGHVPPRAAMPLASLA